VAVVVVLLNFFKTALGIKDIRGFCSPLLRFALKPNDFAVGIGGPVDGFGGGADIETEILKKKNILNNFHTLTLDNLLDDHEVPYYLYLKPLSLLKAHPYIQCRQCF